jgi:hypothetical protein
MTPIDSCGCGRAVNLRKLRGYGANGTCTAYDCRLMLRERGAPIW